MNVYNNTTEFKRSGDSRLFDHYCKFFDKNVVEKFRRQHNSDKSFNGHRAMMRDIESYIQENIKYDSKSDYYNLVDTMKKLVDYNF